MRLLQALEFWASSSVFIFQRGRDYAPMDCIELDRRWIGTSWRYTMHIDENYYYTLEFVNELNVPSAIWIFHSINFETANFGGDNFHFQSINFHPKWGNHTISPGITHHTLWRWCRVHLFGHSQDQIEAHHSQQCSQQWTLLFFTLCAMVWKREEPIMYLIYDIAHLKLKEEKKCKGISFGEMANRLKIRPKINRKWFKFSLRWMETIFKSNKAWRDVLSYLSCGIISIETEFGIFEIWAEFDEMQFLFENL